MTDLALAATLRRLREDRGLAREAVAHRAGISAGALARIELGQSSPGWNTVRRLAAALGLSMIDLAAAVEATDRD
jgi:transcriptional regulator with XRE-family HTH domain